MKSRAVKPSGISAYEQFQLEHVKPKEGRTLIVGSQIYREKEDRRLRYEDVLGIDMLDGPGVDRVLDLEEDLPADLGLFDHVECMSVLEHSRRPWMMAANIERLMEPGATLFVSVPFVWRVHAYPNDYWRMTPEGIKALFPAVTWEKMMFAGNALVEGSKIPAMKVREHPYFPRMDTVAFGRK